MRTAVHAFFALVCILAVGPMMAFAQVPRTISYQGKLVNSEGAPLSGSFSVTFSLYDTATGGAPLWSETADITVANGLFSYPLGAKPGNPFPASMKFDRPYFLGVKVGDDPEMPRQSLHSVPYALALPSVIVDTAGNVGIGTTTPTSKLHVYGMVTAYGFMTPSSRRFKGQIQPISHPLETLCRLQGVRYVWDAEHGGQADIGFIAEDVAKVLPELVRMEPDGKNAAAMDYARISALAVEAIKAQQEQIEELRAENAMKDALLQKLIRRIELLELRSGSQQADH